VKPHLRVGLIGAGRAGTVIARALERAGHSCVAVDAISDAAKARASQLLPSADITDAVGVCEAADLVVVAVPDSSIEAVVTGLVNARAIGARHVVMHLSGAHGTGVLQSASAVGAMVIAAHPAMTLHGRIEDVQRLEHCPFAVTAEGDALPIAQALIIELGGEPVVVAEADRMRYHAALAHASNHSVTLVSQSMELLADIGIDNPGAYLRQLVNASVDHALREGDRALTGPIARGDFATIREHLQALRSARGSTRKSYVALAKATIERQQRELDADTLKAFDE
jgi:predicted short-subunit dehydrogenase-like oxidoreductase (DUF2520 family)